VIPNVSVPCGEKGPWKISNFTISKEPTLENLRLMRDGRGIAPGTYTRLTHARRGVVMSDTTAEKLDHYSFVRAARGHCLINGLGIGMCLNAILLKPEVNFVTVVEADQDVIDLVWPHYSQDRCEIVCASAFDYAPPKGIRYGAVWHDIWDAICEDNLPEMHRLHRKYGRKADWQGSWGRDTIEAERRRERDRYWRW
jgi:hypothetical protein